MQFLAPWIVQAIGVVLLVASFVFWGVTGKQSAEFVTAAMTLILIGVASGVYARARETSDTYERPPRRVRKRPASKAEGPEK